MLTLDIALEEGNTSHISTACLDRVNEHIKARNHALSQAESTSTPEKISHALQACPSRLPDKGLGIEATTDLLLDKICPALAGGQAGPRWYGLVTGGVLPAAQLADQLVTSYDPVVQVHNVEETISTTLEAITLDLLMDLLSLPRGLYTSNTFTTGATASNILGLALGRNETVRRIKVRQGHADWDVGEDGMGGVDVVVYTAAAHASVAKSASIVGIGRKWVEDVSDQTSVMPCDFDLAELEHKLKARSKENKGVIVVVSAGEVNTGGWTSDISMVQKVCEKYDAWLHIDAAFGAFAVLHPDFHELAHDLQLGDSLTLDCHKWLNVPYDCAVLLSRNKSGLYDLCGPGNKVAPPAYLAQLSSAQPQTSADPDKTCHQSAHPLLDPYGSLLSPLFTNLENSRRFRALPVYAALVQLGRQGFQALVSRNISFARTVIRFLNQHPAYQVLTPEPESTSASGGTGTGVDGGACTFKEMNIVLFAPSDAAPDRFQGPAGANVLCREINEGRVVYTTPTKWRGRGAVRIAVSNWATNEEQDWGALRNELERVVA